LAAVSVTIEIVERIRQDISAVGFWKNPDARELLTRRLVRDLDEAGVCARGTERALAQQLVALAKENHENLVRA
jgi:type I restriction enzyme R subunit